MDTRPCFTVLHGILQDALIDAFFAGDRVQFLRLLYERGEENCFAACLARAVLSDENAFSRACAAGKAPSEFVRRAYLQDLAVIARAMQAPAEGFSFGETPEILRGWDEGAADRLARYYLENGCGMWLSHTAFRFDGEPETPRPQERAAREGRVEYIRRLSGFQRVVFARILAKRA